MLGREREGERETCKTVKMSMGERLASLKRVIYNSSHHPCIDYRNSSDHDSSFSSARYVSD